MVEFAKQLFPHIILKSYWNDSFKGKGTTEKQKELPENRVVESAKQFFPKRIGREKKRDVSIIVLMEEPNFFGRETDFLTTHDASDSSC